MVANGTLLTGDRERVRLKEMYGSDRFVKLVRRTQFTIDAVVVLAAMTCLFLIRQNLILSHH
jgi:hypothetical protein